MTPPSSFSGQTRVVVALILWLLAAYTVALRLFAAMAWTRALWQSLTCVLVSPILLTIVVKVLSAPKRLGSAGAVFDNALAPLMIAAQYVLPWLGWSILIYWMNGGQITTSGALGAGAGVALISFMSAAATLLALRPRVCDVAVTQLEVPIAGLPRAFDGYCILHFSDTHGGSAMSKASITARLAAASETRPDLIVFTGDLAASRRSIDATAGELSALSAPDGKLAVLGNHDTRLGEPRVREALSNAGFRVLANEHIALTRGGDRLYVAGIRDASYAREDDLPAALRGIPDAARVIVLTHAPGVILKLGADRASLFLAGHTHGRLEIV